MTRKLAAEFFGTFWLVFGGCGSALLAAAFPQLGIGFAGVAFAFGLTVLTMAYAVGGISGGHFNPAVSLGLAVANRFEWSELIPYWIVQVIGGFAGAAVLYVIASGAPNFTAGGFASNHSLDLDSRDQSVRQSGPLDGRRSVRADRRIWSTMVVLGCAIGGRRDRRVDLEVAAVAGRISGTDRAGTIADIRSVRLIGASGLHGPAPSRPRS